MWWIFPVGFLVLCVLFAFFEYRFGCSEDWSTFFGVMIVISLFLSLLFALATFEDTPVDTGVVGISNLYAFQDGEVTNVSGGGNIFFWGFSSDTGLKYRYITDGNIGKVVREDSIENFEIIDNENLNPRIEYHKFVYKRTAPFWIWMFGDGDSPRGFTVKVAYIPEGSLIRDFNVDLE